MAKNQSITKPETQSQGTFRQFFRAFKRRVSPARPLATQNPNRSEVLNPSTAAVPIEYNHKRPEPMKPRPTNIPAGPKGVRFQGGYNNITEGASNEKFSDFIDETKRKIKANSSFVADENGPKAGTKRATTRRDSFNDRVSHFINRAKLKMRTTTIADGNLQQPYTPR